MPAKLYGSGSSVERERVGNAQLEQMMRLVSFLLELDIPFTIEIFMQSLLWKTPPILELLSRDG